MISRLLFVFGFFWTVILPFSGAEQSHDYYDDSWLCCPNNEPTRPGHATEEVCVCQDRMHTFPGWTSHHPLPSPWYSGYVDYEFQGRMIHTHYVLVLAEQKEDDDDDKNGDKKKPLIYWSNGGPGASSMFGLLTEVGPLVFDDRSKNTKEFHKTGIPTPMYNPYSWTKLGHILMFDVPAPVGFSYCEEINATASATAESKGDSDPIVDCAGLGWTDELAAANTFAALQAFYKKYPVMLSSQTDLFLTGESYAGIYIPTLAREILKSNQNIIKEDGLEQSPPEIPLKGFAVGDGCLGTETGICQILDDDEDGFDLWLVLFLAGHNQIPLNTFQEVLRACQPFLNIDTTAATQPLAYEEDVCKAAVQKVKKQVGGVYDYGLYDDCTYENGLMRPQMKRGIRSSVPVSGGLNDYICGGDMVMGEYLKMDVVRDAFHVGDAEYYETDNAEGFAYSYTEPDLTGFYKDVALNYPNISVLVYNGDTDPAITSFATQNWTSHLGLNKQQDWRPWTVDGCRRMGGYVTRYEGSFDFLTIRGSGHMVPVMKPAAAFTFIKSWLHAQDYPPYIANCSAPSQPSLPLLEKQTLSNAKQNFASEKQYVRTKK